MAIPSELLPLGRGVDGGLGSMSDVIFDRVLGDRREVTVVEFTRARRIHREVQVFLPAPPDSDPAEHQDDCVILGPRPTSHIEDIVRMLPLLALPNDVIPDIVARLRGGARAPLPSESAQRQST